MRAHPEPRHRQARPKRVERPQRHSQRGIHPWGGQVELLGRDERVEEGSGLVDGGNEDEVPDAVTLAYHSLDASAIVNNTYT